ncbi:MAG: MG2 domain-containing protein, partial [Synergistaceae bacterium]|nr:MG2 domain-containing protein [Synergistaceae bacterium]
MKKFNILILMFLIPLLISTPAFSAAPPAIASFSPTGATTDNPLFKAVFSSPMVNEDAVGRIVGMADFPFEVSPLIIADGRWESTTTFTANLIAPLPKATSFLVTAGGKKFNFHTEPPELLSASQSSYTLSSGIVNVRIKLEFNIPVLPSRLSSFLKVTTSANKRINYSLVGGLPSRTIMLEAKLTGNDAKLDKLMLTVAKGLTANVGTLGLAKDAKFTVDISPVLEITDSGVNEWDGSISISTNNRVNIGRAQQFITVEPASNFRLESRWSGFSIVGDFKPRQRVVVNIKKGVPAADGSAKLAEDFQKAFIIPDKQPSVTFPSSGMFLSPAAGTRIPVETINISELDITLWRIYESNLPYVLRKELHRYNFPFDLSARVAKKTARISHVPNETARHAIDIKSFVGENSENAQQGLYMLTAKEKSGYSWRQAEQIISLSDIGLTARIWPGGCLVWANSISTGKPVENAVIRIYSDASQLIAEGRTDFQGLCRYFPDDLNTKPALITVAKGGDVSFVQLRNPLITHETFDTSGRAWITSGYDGMLFTPRGIYRPGETVNAKAIVREASSGVPSNFPVLYTVRDPMGKTFTKGTAALSDHGTADIEFQLPNTASTGEYAIELSIPGKEETPFASVKLSVESFAPPRIEVDLKRTDKNVNFIFKNEDVTFEISSKYLFGVPAANMPWTLKFNAVAGNFVPTGDKWTAFKFGDPEKSRNIEPSFEELESGTLDQEGKETASFKGTFDWDPPSVVDLTLVASVMEDSGRWISKELPFKYFVGSWNYILGIEA